MTPEEKALKESAPPTSAFPQPLPQPTDEGREIVKAFVAKGKVHHRRPIHAPRFKLGVASHPPVRRRSSSSSLGHRQ